MAISHGTTVGEHCGRVHKEYAEMQCICDLGQCHWRFYETSDLAIILIILLSVHSMTVTFTLPFV